MPTTITVIPRHILSVTLSPNMKYAKMQLKTTAELKHPKMIPGLIPAFKAYSPTLIVSHIYKKKFIVLAI